MIYPNIIYDQELDNTFPPKHNYSSGQNEYTYIKLIFSFEIFLCYVKKVTQTF